MEKVVLDTSVIVKWFVEEENSAKARKLLENYSQGKLKIVLPEAIILELANALFFGAKYEGSIFYQALKAFFSLKIPLVSLDFSLIRLVQNYMEKFGIASYDALFIALAEKERIPLITADKKHHQKNFYSKIKYL